jgi:hypothetical protein
MSAKFFFHRRSNCLQRPRNAFLSAHSWVLETARSQPGTSQESTADDPWQRCFSCYKLRHSKRRTCRCVVVLMNQRATSPQLSSLAPHGNNKPFQHLQVVACLNNRGPFGHRFKVDDTADAKKADQHSSNLGVGNPLFLWPKDSS